MKKLIHFCLLFCLKQITQGQTIIYADGYPKGLICVSFDPKEKVFYPLENSQLKCVIHKDEINYVLKGTDTLYKNAKFESSDKVVMPIEQNTGKINFNEVVENKNSQRDMYNALKSLPNSTTKYEYISGNDADQSTVNYKGVFYVKFAGDLNTVEFILNIKVKDNKIKYEFTNFRMYFVEQKGSSIKGGKNYTMGATNIHDNPLERFYIESYRGDKFWREISQSIYSTIGELKSFVAKPIKSDW
jgi:hypothetical protein